MANNRSQGTISPHIHPAEWAWDIFEGLSLAPDESFPDSVRERIPAGWVEEEDGENYLTEEIQEGLRCLEWVRDARGVGTYLFCQEGTPDGVVDLVQWLLTHDTRNTRFATFEIAHTCDKVRQGEFGGSAWFITRDSAECMGTSIWLREKEEAFKKQL
jgi:hypothetical protein